MSSDELLRNAERHALGFAKGELPARPATGVAIVTCMDARINVFELFGLSAGDAHILRNAGGIATDDVIRSLMISQRLLGTNEILVVHHTDCGMLNFRDGELSDQIEAETGERPTFEFGAFDDVGDDVRRSVSRINASPFIVHKHVRGFIYDNASGQLTEEL